MERVRHDVLAVHDLLDGALDAAQHRDFTDVVNERVARRHGAEQGFQFEVLNQSVRVRRQRLFEIKIPISEHEESFHDPSRSFKPSYVTRYFSAMDIA